MPHKVFWLEPTELERVWLRRYRSSSESSCPLPDKYHNAFVFLKDRPHADSHMMDAQEDPDRPAKDSSLWPALCGCDYTFQDSDRFQVFNMQLFRGAPDGNLYTLRDVPAGAMWNADWLAGYEWATGPDGISLHVKLPNGNDWCVDQEASNCDKKQWQPVADSPNSRHWCGRTHYCWVRHGDPRTGNIHVDKNGVTCGAGAGSILSGSYHGFLHNGYLTP
jgi:hypothetical protein